MFNNVRGIDLPDFTHNESIAIVHFILACVNLFIKRPTMAVARVEGFILLYGGQSRDSATLSWSWASGSLCVKHLMETARPEFFQEEACSRLEKSCRKLKPAQSASLDQYPWHPS
jgi:hypothetical protein